MIKGRYVGIITVDFAVNEGTPGLLPFEQLHDQVTKKFNGVVRELITEEISDIATVTVEQQYADLYKTEVQDDGA